MYLRSITLKGFKSFPDRTRLEFGPGVSVVVGPNGSGKSNITDAVLWALGEQSPLAVRGQSMQDVIFAGAPGRQASRSAEVELVLDDSEGVLGLGSSEVSIVRRLDRSGEGEYRLAGARCRLVDVIEVLSDTGLGKEMHSVISQGRVESIVTSKPRDRRLLIEEAAGLGKHRKRRRRAQLKLARTQDNLDRALDVEREARTRLKPLKRQAEAAEQHARLERQALEARWELGRDQLRTDRETLEVAGGAAAKARAARAELEAGLEAVAARREAAEVALAGRSAQREELSRRCFLATRAAERVGDRAEALNGSLRSIETRLARTREQLALVESQAAAEVPDDGAPSRIARLERELDALERDRETELAAQLTELEEQLAEAASTVVARGMAVEEALAHREQAEEAAERGRTELREAERSVESARREAARVGGELAAVNQFLAAQAGGLGGARTLADQLQVDPGYELAVAAALDGRLGAALAATQPDAGALLDRAGADGGRVLIAGEDAGPGRPASDRPAPGAEPLADHVHGPQEVERLARALLRGVWVLDSLEAIADRFSGIAVTRAGRVYSPQARELRQAPALGQDRVLAERNRREELLRATEAAATAELAAAAGLEHAARSLQRLDDELGRATAAHRLALHEREEATEEQRRIAARIERRRAAPEEGPRAGQRIQLASQLAAEHAAQQRLARERSDRESLVARLAGSVSVLEQLLPVIAELVATLGVVRDAIAFRGESFEQALAADREAGENVAAELRECAAQEAQLQSKLHGAHELLTEAEVALQRAGDRAAESEQELQTVAARLELGASPASEALDEETRAALLARLERLARRREQLGPVNPFAREEYAEAVEHVEALERQRVDLETALRELQKLIADTDRQIRETFEQTFEAAAANFERVAAQLFPGGQGRLRLVAEREGPERTLGGAAPARDDSDPELAAAEDEELEPAAPEDEERLLGVEIEINPAGKEMKRLTLLSGGEKSMTALAFLFAVFLARPCPFYILDEVEAALDDLNIDRFLELLRSFSTQAQFIVVTHQRRTMDAADFLYGVSMGGDGISKVISRRLPRGELAA